ncbi:hypothetical protein SELMODRAFT_432229 [Selaginella moellendorffii]|uniref:Replication protein A OB domain-containing protein n=1 Tax=Selaginella moellendorffii TaxID=88036 RepID=D8TFD2_SELML|nr:hypothetical protein SELMODRAFT_432229 [Selaginella moellendorffii]
MPIKDSGHCYWWSFHAKLMLPMHKVLKYVLLGLARMQSIFQARLSKCNVDWTNISPKDSGAFMRRRMLSLSDESGHSIDMCLWDSKAEDEGSEIEEKPGQGERPIVCVKGSRISDYNGKFISVTVKEFQTGDFYYPACMKVVNGRQCGKKLCILDSTVWVVAFDDANEIVEMPACF